MGLIKFIRKVLQSVKKKALKHQNKKLIKMIWYCIDCCLKCYERCIEYITNAAYVQVFATGSNFCPAAKNAFFLIVKNLGRIATVTMAGVLFLFLGKLFIACGCGGAVMA